MQQEEEIVEEAQSTRSEDGMKPKKKEKEGQGVARQGGMSPRDKEELRKKEKEKY